MARAPIPALAALSVVAAACAPTWHTAPRYRYFPPAAQTVEAEARARCELRGAPAGEPVHPFVTDGCSMWPDGSWQSCCVSHDMDYWCGGSRRDRAESDERLRACVAERASGWLGTLMRVGVWVGGPPWLPAYWRWGYGHRYPSGYSENAGTAPSDG